MISELFCLTSAYSVGCTFLDWSIHWLSGAESMFSAAQGAFTSLVSNPLKKINAHGHARNMSSGLDDSIRCVQQLGLAPAGCRSFYATNLPMDICAQRMGIPIDQIEQEIDRVIDYQKKDYVAMLEYIANQRSIPTVIIGTDISSVPYFWQTRTLDRKLFSAGAARSIEEFEQEFDSVFFRTSSRQWQDQGLTNIWDIRERMALDLRPFAKMHYQNLTISAPHLWINCQELWFDTDRTVCSIMAWLGIEIVQHRRDSWLPVMKNWVNIQNDNLKFYREVNQIVQSTVNGHYHEIPRLTLKQEAIVLHFLMYHHGMNIRSWQLERFPGNSLDLHQMLEPLQHRLVG